MSDPRYTVIIQWSDEDQVYVVSLPEWGPFCKTHGTTYEEAAKNAREVLELLIETDGSRDERALPEPRLFHFPGADVVDLPDSDSNAEAPSSQTEAAPSRQTA